MKRRYLFTLEVAPVETGKAYAELPSHLTLMSRFLSDLPPSRLAQAARPLFEQAAALKLVFGATTQLGPKRLTVHLVEHSSELKQLHDELCHLLISVGASFEYPQFTGEGHKPHVTKREDAAFNAGDSIIIKNACLIEVVEGQRIIRSKLRLR